MFRESWLLLLWLPLLVSTFWVLKQKIQPLKVPIHSKVFPKVRGLEWLERVRLLILFLLILALAGPRWGLEQTTRQLSGIDMMLTLDVSLSMLADDMAEESRLEVAKRVLTRFVEARTHDRMGLVIFSGEALTLSPLTVDSSVLYRALKQSRVGKLNDGTAIGDALALSVRRLQQSSARSKVVILLTDGDNNQGRIQPAMAGELAQGFGIKVYTILIGKEGPIRLPIHQYDAAGKIVGTTYIRMQNSLNPQLLMQLSEQTGGKFFRVTETRALEHVFQEIDQLEKYEFEEKVDTRYEEYYGIPLGLAVLLLALFELLARFGRLIL
jgi:Ca-activated chloride channel homolog